MFRRPDGRVFTRDPGDVDDGADTYASVDGDLEPWLAAGFVEHRRENRYVVPTGAPAAEPPAGISFVTVDRVDIDRLRGLDDELRQDVPGTDGWRWPPDEFHEETAGADPEVYLVAVDDAAGDYVGIARVWGTRLGFVGVARPHRRRRLGAPRPCLRRPCLARRRRGDDGDRRDERRFAPHDRAARCARRRPECRGRP